MEGAPPLYQKKFKPEHVVPQLLGKPEKRQTTPTPRTTKVPKNHHHTEAYMFNKSFCT
jgi:hypothetical protein